MVVIDEVDRAERAVLLHLSHHAAYTVAVVGIVFHGQADAVIASGNQLAVRCYIPPYALMHDGFQVVGGRKVLACLRPAFRHWIGREELHGVRPFVAVFGCLHDGLAGSLMLVAGICQIVQVELPVPIGYHRLMVIGPGLLATHGLDSMDTHHGLQAAVVTFRTRNGSACIVNHIAVVLL